MNTIFQDNSGRLWLGTQNGVVEFDQIRMTSARYIQGKGNSISSICEDEYGTLWIGTRGNGLYSFDKRTLKSSQYIHVPEEPTSISSNVITSVFKERSGTIWIATMDGGVNKINRVKQPFKKYSFDEVRKIVLGNNNKLWIGTANGYYIFNPENERSKPYSFGSDELIEEEKSGDLWMELFQVVFINVVQTDTLRIFILLQERKLKGVFCLCGKNLMELSGLERPPEVFIKLTQTKIILRKNCADQWINKGSSFR